MENNTIRKIQKNAFENNLVLVELWVIFFSFLSTFDQVYIDALKNKQTYFDAEI